MVLFFLPWHFETPVNSSNRPMPSSLYRSMTNIYITELLSHCDDMAFCSAEQRLCVNSIDWFIFKGSLCICLLNQFDHVTFYSAHFHVQGCPLFAHSEKATKLERKSSIGMKGNVLAPSRYDYVCVHSRMRERRRDEKSDNSPATPRPFAASRAAYRSPDTRLSRKPGPTNWPLW